MKNRTIIGIICMVLAVITIFAATPIMNRMSGDSVTVVRLSKDVKQDKGCMPLKVGNCRFTPTGNAVREFQNVLPFGIRVKTSMPIW